MEQKSRILIIDDSLEGKSQIEKHFQEEPIVIDMAADAIEGFVKAENDPPDLILVDLTDSWTSVFGLAARVRKSPVLTEIPLVMVTGFSDVDMRVKCFEAGADDVIQKPYNSAELQAIVRNVLKLNRFRKLAEQREQLHRMLLHVQNAYDATIEGWMKALDLRDQETEGHSVRVADLSVKLAKHMGIHPDHIPNIRRGALLHDIGKLAIPDSILKKAGPLTLEERRLINRHPMFAHEMLYQIEYLRDCLEIPIYHHEKWDGTGYPYGLKEDQIPFAARLFAIIDVWDALSFDRPYRKALPQEEVREYLAEQSGVHFDPAVTTAFLELLEKLGDVTAHAQLWERKAA